MVRGFVGFVMGLVVMGAISFTGMLDGIPHWWFRNVTHRIVKAVDDDPEHVRYAVSTLYRPGDDAQGGCAPRYEFVNRTKRTVTFQPDGDGDPGNRPGPGVQRDYGRQDGRNDESPDDSSQPNGHYGDDLYDEDYPGGGSQQSECNAGVIKIILDRMSRAPTHRPVNDPEQALNESRPNR